MIQVVSGSQTYLRDRLVRKLVQQAKSRGWEIHPWVETEEALVEGLQTSFLAPASRCLVIDSGVLASGKKKGWSEEALGALIAVGKSADVLAIVVQDGDTLEGMAAGVLAALPDTKKYSYAAPKPWEEKPFAIRFFRNECKPLSVSEDMAESIVQKTGLDFGVLSWEAVKLKAFQKETGHLDVKDIARLVSQYGMEDWDALKESLAMKQPAKLSRLLQTLQNITGGEAFVKAVIILTTTAGLWLRASLLLAAGSSEEETADRLKINPYRFRLTVLPALRNWTTPESLTLLYKNLSLISVKKGHQNPWVLLEATLLRSLT